MTEGSGDVEGSDPVLFSIPTSSTVGDMPAVVRYPPHLRRSLLTAVIVGTILFVINQLDVVMGGDATTATWIKGALTYLVPFVVSNVGILIATQERS